MNRRTFLASLFAIPAGVALAVKAEAEPLTFIAYKANAMGIHAMLRDHGNAVEKPLDLDEIFDRLYELKQHREREPQQLYWHNPDGSLSPLNCYYP